METKLNKKYGLFTAICMVVGIVIGSGVFFKAQVILQKTNGNVPLGVWAWAIGGVIMLACMLAFSVMATKFEKVNGVVDYAEALVGSKYAYFVGWFMTFIYYPTMTSALAWLSARYSLTFLQSTFTANEYLQSIDPVTGVECMVLSMIFLVGAYAVNALSPKIAGYFQVSTTVIKLIPLLLMAVVGIIVGLTSKDQYLVQNFAVKVADDVNSNPLFSAVVATSFAYEGWVIATSINAELKNSKRNLPIALVSGGIIIVVIYIIYYIGVSGGASVKDLQETGATVAFTNVFGKFGAILNVFVAISCMGTLNGLMLGTTRGMYSIAVRGKGLGHKTFAVVDDETNMPSNSAILGLLLCAVWFVYFYGANLAPSPWFGFFCFDPTELPIVTTYPLYIPIFIMFMVKAKDQNIAKRIIVPIIAIAGCVFMVVATVYAHGVTPYLAAKADGKFSLPILAYLIIFAVVMVIGMVPLHADYKKKK